MVEDRPIMSVKYCIQVPFFQFRPKLTHSAAIAEHLVSIGKGLHSIITITLIIVNVLIRVTLQQERCRGTLQSKVNSLTVEGRSG